MPWGWIFAQIIRDGRSTWRLTFLWWGQVCFPMHLYGHHTFVWEKCWEFQTTSPLKPLGQCCSNFMWSLLRLGERKIAEMVVVHWPRWLPCLYMVKTFKNLLRQNQISPWGLTFAQILRDRKSTKIAKMMVLRWRVTFLGQGQILCGPCTLIWEKCWEFIFWTSPL